MTKPAPDQTSYNYCALPLAAYACRPDHSVGRLHPQEDSQFRTCFQRDRDRIIHTTAFRRLEYKTQVFVNHEGDHYRTRLTHTLEVAQVSRTIARALMVNEDLAEAVALAHDLGHTPFAHVGEDVLDECMKDVGGYDHNDQSLRVLTVLEQKYPDWPGLNLSWETLEGVVKHNGPLLKKGEKWQKAKTLPITVRLVQEQRDLRLDTYAPVEAQVAALADDIAYNNHDVDDGLRAGLFTIEDIAAVPMIAEILIGIRKEWPSLSENLLVCEMVRRTIGAMVEDVIEEAGRRLKELNPQSVDDVRMAGRAMVAFSPLMHKRVEELREFLWARMYRHYKVNRMREKIGRIVRELYGAFMEQYTLLPDPWQRKVEEVGGLTSDVARARIVADYIAGMTDRFAMREHERMFEVGPEMG